RSRATAGEAGIDDESQSLAEREHRAGGDHQGERSESQTARIGRHEAREAKERRQARRDGGGRSKVGHLPILAQALGKAGVVLVSQAPLEGSGRRPHLGISARSCTAPSYPGGRAMRSRTPKKFIKRRLKPR